MRVAIVGCGQLSRMLAQAGIPLGIKFSFVADANEDVRCVEGLGVIVRWSSGDSIDELYEALEQPDRVTVEKEQVDVALLRALAAFCPVHPNPDAIAACQHRHQEKQLLEKVGIPCSPYFYGHPADPGAAKIPLPVVVKSCREGYDGKNQWVLKSAEDVDAFSPESKDDSYIVEQWIPFDREISQVSVRDVNGDISHYPLAENHHEQGILKQSIAPAAAVSDQLRAAAQGYISQLMETLDYVGVLAMECFVVNEQLLVNELAPRVHNSGHWTQSGSDTSQFENHVRAISGMPLGSTRSVGVTGMVNLIGTEKPAEGSLIPKSSLNWYGKVVRPGRKLGHINIASESHDELLQQISVLATKINGA